MLCAKCGHEIMDGAAFCPYCGEKVAQTEPGPDVPVYQAEVKGLLKSGRIVVYRDRTEFVTSSVQKAVYAYDGLVAVKKGWDSIDFVTEDGRTESCPAGRKTVHEAFLYIEKMYAPYEAKRKERLLSQGVRYSFPSSQGLMNSGVLDLSDRQAEFKAKSGKSEVISYRDVKSVSAAAGTLDFTLFGGGARSFAVGKEQRDEVLAYVKGAIEPFLAQRKADLLARGIYFSFLSPEGVTVDILADRAECKSRSGQGETVSFPDIRAVSTYGGMLEIGLTDGTSRSFPVDEEESGEVLAFVREAIAPYVAARTEGFDAAFGVDEKLEINPGRGVFHILRQGGREITPEWPLEALTGCEWVESRELNALGSVVSGGIALFKTAAKAAGNQAVTEAEDRISCAGVVLTLAGQESDPLKVWFGIFTAGMSRTNKKFERYLEEWARLADFLRESCPGCALVEPEPLPEPESQPAETGEVPESGAWEEAPSPEPVPAQVSTHPGPEAAARRDDLGVSKYIEGVSRFIGNCPTPMTIAFQGNRGSGKNSALGMLFDQLEDRYGGSLYWLNARQLPKSGSGEELTALVGKVLAGLLSGEGSGAKQAGSFLTGLAGLATGIIAGDASIGKEIAGGVLNKNADGGQGNPVMAFSRLVEGKTRGEHGKIIFFLDGLDQLEPARAAELLDAMRDYFICPGCVFVVSAEYAHILRGAQKRYDENRAKGLFDEMFKMTFRVPASSFSVQDYTKGKLEDMDVRAGEDGELELYAALIQHSVGQGTEAIDRLFTSYQLLKDMTGGEVFEDRYKRLALFALLCMQTSFRAVYSYAARMRGSVTAEFLAGLCGDSAQLWDAVPSSDEEREAYRAFGGVLSRVVNLDSAAEISPAECRAFAEVLELSAVTSR